MNYEWEGGMVEVGRGGGEEGELRRPCTARKVPVRGSHAMVVQRKTHTLCESHL